MTTPNTSDAVGCPKCGSSDVVPIIYGLPTRETEERLIVGKSSGGLYHAAGRTLCR